MYGRPQEPPYMFQEYAPYERHTCLLPLVLLTLCKILHLPRTNCTAYLIFMFIKTSVSITVDVV